MLERGLRTIGLARDDVHWTNAVLCECSKDDMATAAKQCRKRLRQELININPAAIMPMGAFALQGVLGLSRKPRVADYRGSVSVVDNKLKDVTQNVDTYTKLSTSCLVTPSYHPAYIMRDPASAFLLEKDVERLGRILQDGWTPIEFRPETTLAVCQNDLTALDLITESDVCLDIETTKEPPALAKLTCFVVADRKSSVIVPYSRTLDGQSPWWADWPSVADRVNKLLRGRRVITHNGFCFDWIVLNRYGIQADQRHDTILAAHALYGHLRKNLFEVASRYLDVMPWKRYEHNTIEELWDYAHKDGLNTIHLWHAMKNAVGQ
jgi:uracil-DNA glycosylase family 4